MRDFASAEAFYAGTLGLEVLDRTNPFALVLQAAGGATIRCALTPDMEPQPFTIVGWEVPDIRAAVRKLTDQGVKMIRYPYFTQDADGVWRAPGGAMVAWFHDPDGNVLSLSQQRGAGEG